MLLLGRPASHQDCNPTRLVQNFRPSQPHKERLLVGMCLRDNTAVCMGCAVHPIIKHAMQAPRSHLEVLSSK